MASDGIANPPQVFLDTNIWLDLANNDANSALLGALENLVSSGDIELIVPKLVRDEFDRNRDRVVKESGRSLSGNIKRARAAVWTYGNARQRRAAARVLDDIDRRLSGAIDVTAEAMRRIDQLFAIANWSGDNESAKHAAANRALLKQAPFHTGRNSFGDAMIIELYGQLARSAKGRCVFVTHNYKDFSTPGGDHRKPHLDIAPYFSRVKSRYFVKLVDALRVLRPLEFAGAMYEHELSFEPRRASKIHDAIEELIDRVWYDRHMVMRYKVETGRCKVIASKDFTPKHYRASGGGRLIVDTVLAGAIKSAERLEKKYGKDSLGPYSKFEWGMINGKLSALRWVLGEDWDELYT